MKIEKWFKSSPIWGRIKESKVFYVLTLAVFALIAIKILFPSSPPLQETDTSMPATSVVTNSQWRKWEGEIERDLAFFLSQVKGAGKVQVMISLEQHEQGERAIDTEKTTVETQELDSAGGERIISEARENQKTVLEQHSGGTTTVWISQTAPVVRGVIVIAEGAKDPTVRVQLARAVQTYFDIPLYKVSVLVK